MERKEAIEIVRKLYNESLFLKKDKEAMVTLIPELKENDDERIRKNIIDFFKDAKQGLELQERDNNQWQIEQFEIFISWLEKQGGIDKTSYEIAEKEKREFVGDGFIKCYADFQDFKEGETYWLEYLGNDDYNVRSDNLLGKTYHITPCQLYTIFKRQTWLEKQSKKVEPIEGFNSEFERQISQLIASIINKEHEYTEAFVKWTSDALLNYAKRELEKRGEQKPANRVKPKFKVGDYIERKDGLGCHAKIIFVGKNVYGCKKLIYPEDSSPFFKLMFENQDEFKISSDFQRKPTLSKKDSLYYDDICEILINLLHSESPNVNKSAIQKDLDWFITFVKQTKK